MSPAPKRPQPPEHQPPPSERGDTAEQRIAVEDFPQATCVVEPADAVDRPHLLEGDFTAADKENIEACADLSYIRYFECAFEAMRILAAGFQDGRFPLECKVAVDVDAWSADSVNHVPAAERQAMGARVLAGVEQLLDDLYEALLAVYEARAGCCDEHSVPPAAQHATLAWVVEHIQLELSRRGAGAPAFTARRVGGELMDAFKILGSPDLARFLGGGYDEVRVSLVDNIDRLLGDRKPDGSPRMPAYQLAELAVNSRRAIDQVACLDRHDLKTLTMAEIDGLTARVALLRAVAGRRDFHGKREQLDDDAAQAAAKVIRLTRTAGSPF